MQQGVSVVVNPGAGVSPSDSYLDDLEIALKEADVNASVDIVRSGHDLDAIVQTAVGGDSQIIVAVGGDGTVSAVAQAVLENEKVLAIIPRGTLNHFAKDLGIPLDSVDALKVIKNGIEKRVDVGEVNGRFFINNSSIGLYPRIVWKRERQQRLGRGKWWSAAWATWQLFLLSPFSEVTLDVNGKVLRRKTPFVFIGNNEYEIDIYNIGRRIKLDTGCLSVYLMRRSGRMGLLLLVIHTLFGRLKELKDFENFKTSHLSIVTRKTRTLVAIDGEVAVMETPLEYRIHPKKLRVLVPRSED